jgi:hypothetical protein
MAALSVSSKRFPGMTHRAYSVRQIQRPIELPHLETFPGAACYQPIELPCYKAAPLQAGGLTISPGSLAGRKIMAKFFDLSGQ